MNNEIVVIGFPKCGTSALMNHFIDDPEVEVLRHPKDGSLEIIWPLIKEYGANAKHSIRVHKFGAYIYNQSALEYLRDINPECKFILCIRDPSKVLVSWHNMHRSIAKSEKYQEHFAFKNREFYSKCSISEYYDHYAQSKLKFDDYFLKLLTIIPKKQLIVVSQERMAEDIRLTAEFIKRPELEELLSSSISRSKSVEPHKGYADNNMVSIEKRITDELVVIQERLIESIKISGVREFIVHTK